MPSRRVSFWCSEAERDRRLDEVLFERLAEALGRPLSRAKVRRLIMAGAVSLNGRPLRRAAERLGPGARVEVMVDLARLEAGGTAHDRHFVMGEGQVLYEDARILVVDKPPGLPTHSTLDASRDHLVAAVQRFLRERNGLAPSAPAPYLGLHQRLDRDTSGVLLLVKDPGTNAAVGRLFAERRVEKTYQALTARPATLPPPEWSARSFLAAAPRQPGQGKRTHYRSVRAGGAPAHTDFQVLETLPRGLYLQARPHTGRTHQIRVHLSEAGLPILGDDLYGPPRAGRRSPGGDAGDPPRLMLHAACLVFPDPATGEELRVESPLPKDFVDCLNRLSADENPKAR